MVKTTHLRLNNTVAHQGRIGSVVRIDHEGVTVEYKNGDLSKHISDDRLSGVELTPDLLQQAGFSYLFANRLIYRRILISIFRSPLTL